MMSSFKRSVLNIALCVVVGLNIVGMVYPASGDTANIESVKRSPFPNGLLNGYSQAIPIGTAYSSVASKCSWREYESPKGATVVEVTGIIDDVKLRKIILNELAKKFAPPWGDRSLYELPEVVEFVSQIKRFNVWCDYELFHEAVMNPVDGAKSAYISRISGFDKAEQTYIKAITDHFNSTVSFKAKFYISLAGNNFEMNIPMVIISGGLYAGKEIEYYDLTGLIQVENLAEPAMTPIEIELEKRSQRLSHKEKADTDQVISLDQLEREQAKNEADYDAFMRSGKIDNN